MKEKNKKKINLDIQFEELDKGTLREKYFKFSPCVCAACDCRCRCDCDCGPCVV